MLLFEIGWNRMKLTKKRQKYNLTLFLDRIGQYYTSNHNFYDKNLTIYEVLDRSKTLFTLLSPYKVSTSGNRHFTERNRKHGAKVSPESIRKGSRTIFTLTDRSPGGTIDFWLSARQGLVSETGARNMARQVISAYWSANVEGAIVSRNGNHQCRLNVSEFLRSCAKFASGAPPVTV